ncbi:nicotinamide-nucleotide amidase [Microbacterium halimionae]|uniref:Nicotinamide-nucleotide amidase n=1 Tax=Microbacterium halimionae TaxID=1526413 RepID=A0A7W3PM16_9MICO|nr:nicotinamide-nucleotide amidase [Microbacterium halimionae]NII95364.1 nicotinamide-nucleotide amidase [Microbacterium halimionae]
MSDERPPIIGVDDFDVETTVVRRKKRMSDAERLLARLAELKWTVATAESLTGGLVVASLVAVPGASAHVRGGIVAYATDVKQSLLGVDATQLALHGAVESKVARQMAEKVRDALAEGGTRVDVGIATTGIAGPQSPDGQPVGTVHIAVSTPLGTRVESLVLEGDREAIRAETVRRSLKLALSAL